MNARATMTKTADSLKADDSTAAVRKMTAQRIAEIHRKAQERFPPGTVIVGTFSAAEAAKMFQYPAKAN